MAEHTEPVDILSVTFEDYSNENSNVSLYIPLFTAANMAQNITDLLGAGGLVAAIRNVTLCNPLKSNINIQRTSYNMGRPTDKNAQRETALVVGLVDTVNGRKSHISIPGADRDALQGINTDDVDYTNVQWLALKTALESFAKSRDGNPVVVEYGKIVGRRS